MKKKKFSKCTRATFFGGLTKKRRKKKMRSFFFWNFEMFCSRNKVLKVKRIYLHFISLSTFTTSDVCNNRKSLWMRKKGLKNTHVIRFNWIFMPNILRFSSDIHPNHPRVWNTCHRAKTNKKVFFSVIFPFCWIEKFVKWFMRSSSTDNKSFV